MPLITAKRAGQCTACGGQIRKGERCWYTSESGLRHPEPTCCLARVSGYRTNHRAGACTRCGASVPARAGRLEHLGERQVRGRFVQQWAVRCAAC